MHLISMCTYKSDITVGHYTLYPFITSLRIVQLSSKSNRYPQIVSNHHVHVVLIWVMLKYIYHQGRSQDLQKGGAEYIKGARAKHAKKFLG